MKKLTVDRVREILPELDELRALLDRMVGASAADASRTWAGSGSLGTAGSRLVDVDSIDSLVHAAATAESEHLRRIHTLCARAIRHAAEGAADEAARCLLDAAAAEELRDRPERAAEYAHSACTLAAESSDVALESLALRRRARARRASGRLDDASRDYARAFERSRVSADDEGAAEAAIGAGNVLEEQGLWDDAERWYRTALEMMDAGAAPRPERWHALLNLHVVLRSKGAVAASRAPLDEAEAVAEELRDPGATQFIENARGQLFMAEGRFEEAERHLRTARHASTNARASVTIRLNLAETLLASGRHLDAAEEARNAERVALASGLHTKLPEVYRLLGRIAAAEGNPDSFVLFERSLDLIAARKLPDLERAMTLQAYADAERRLGSASTADDLSAEADRIYRRLGTPRRRSEWADEFGGGPSAADTPQPDDRGTS